MATLIWSLLDEKWKGSYSIHNTQHPYGANPLLFPGVVYVPSSPRFGWVFATETWDRFIVKVSVPQLHGLGCKLLIGHVWSEKPIHHHGPVMELLLRSLLVEQKHVFDAY
jgi:hypothetical protein